MHLGTNVILGETYINKKVVARQVIACFAVVILFLGTFLAGHIFTVKRLGQTSFTESKTIEIPIGWENPYKDLVRDEVAYYIIEVNKPMKGNNNLAVSILLYENPKQNPYAVNINANGTTDNGMFQLNSAYQLYFAGLYWPFDKYDSNMSFDWSNWQHNTWVALHLINDLYKDFDGDVEKVIAAYNAGPAPVVAGDIPQSTIDYRDRVLKLYTLLSNS